MSRTGILIVRNGGHVAHFGEVRNAHLFYVSIWEHLMRKHGYQTPGRFLLDDPGLERLWSDISKLPRRDALILAATFDRCWFDRETAHELACVLRKHEAGNEAWDAIATAIGDLIDHEPDAIGVAFDSSISNAWHNASTDDYRNALIGDDVTRASALLPWPELEGVTK